MSELNEEELLNRVRKLIEQDRDAGLEMILTILKEHEEEAVNSTDSDPQHKLSAIEKMEEHFKKKEEYLKCAFLKRLADRINEKAKVRRIGR